jgi:putative endonuclease
MFYVYVLVEKETRDTYIGYSSNLRKRVVQHQTGSGAKTTKHGDWHLVYYEAYLSEKDAINRERKLKHYGQSRTHLFRRIKNSIDWPKISAGCCGRR